MKIPQIDYPKIVPFDETVDFYHSFTTENLELPDCNLLHVLPLSNVSETHILEARINYRCEKYSAMYLNSPEWKEQMIYPIVISESSSDSTHFTKRNEWQCYQLIYTERGEGTLIVNDRMYTLAPGSFFLLDCRPYHYFYAGKEGWEYNYIHFAGGNSDYLCRAVAGSRLLFEQMDGTPIKAAFDRIFQLSRQDAENFDLLFHGIITDILVHLQMKGPAVEVPRNIPSWLGDVQAYISLHYAEEIRVEDLAAIAYLSTGRFAHRYAELTGSSPIEAQYRIRIDHAKAMLKNSDLAIEEIGEKTGFHTNANFYAAFRKYTGMTPGQYRAEGNDSLRKL